MKLGEILLEIVRSDLVESVHAGHLLVVDEAGNDRLALGDLDSLIYPRSAIKGIQASAMVRAGLKVSPKELALVCASHAGSAEHLATATSILNSVKLDASALRNTPDKPLDPKERAAWGDRKGTSLSANCSGKHAGMIATCVVNGWDIGSYKDPNHPLQLAIKAEFESLSGESITKVSIDGCGAPLFALSIRGITRAIQNLVTSTDPVHQEVFQACTSNPVMVSGVGRLPTILMSDVPGLFVKDGAEGVMVMASKNGAITWKMSDGSQRGAETLANATLSHLGIEFTPAKEPVMGDGRVVGEIRASKLVRYE